MKANVGGIDRLARIALGLCFIAYALINGVLWAWPVGLIVLGTGVFRFCGLYKLIGVNTCAVKS